MIGSRTRSSHHTSKAIDTAMMIVPPMIQLDWNHASRCPRSSTSCMVVSATVSSTIPKLSMCDTPRLR